MVNMYSNRNEAVDDFRVSRFDPSIRGQPKEVMKLLRRGMADGREKTFRIIEQ